MLYSEQIPDNLGIIFRREFTDLRDSTVKDFERYTGLKVDSQRNVQLSNKSTIMFRHIEELNNIQNVNLGWFAIEQGDELDSDKEFFLLFGRLRRNLTPSKEFLDLGLPVRSGFIIANAGDHWMKQLWKENGLEDGELIEATTWDNADVLPKDYLDGLKTLEKTKPDIYKRFVLNDWSVGEDQNILIPMRSIDALEGVIHNFITTKEVVAIDPSQGGDEGVIYAISNGEITDEKILHERDTMKFAGESLVFANSNKIDDIEIDGIGIGAGIGDRLREMGKQVDMINSAEKATDSGRFANRRTEIWWYLSEQIMDKKIPAIKDPELKKQIASVRYKIINSNGRVALEPKELTKKRLGCSPDRADAFAYGIWGLQFVKDKDADERNAASRFRDKNKELDYMAA